MLVCENLFHSLQIHFRLEVSQGNFFFFFLQKNVKGTKRQIKPKPTNKTKTSERKAAKATSSHAQNFLRGRKLFILRFLKKFEIVLVTSFTILLLIPQKVERYFSETIGSVSTNSIIFILIGIYMRIS